MAKISAKLRERILGERRALESGNGVVISNRDITKIRVRILPSRVKDELPGSRFISYYSEALRTEKKGSASPESFGRPCPIAAAMDIVNRTGSSKEEKQEAREFANKSTEYWIPVIDRSVEQDPENPTINILAAKKTVYQEILRFMEDEDVGKDITHPDEGCDILIKKTGTGRDTKWTVAMLEESPLHEDEATQEAILEAAKDFDERSHFFPINEEVLEKLYEGLTGKSMPDKFRGEGKGKRKDEDDEDEKPKSSKRRPSKDEDDEKEPELEPGARVSFDNEGETYVGKVVSIEGKDAVVAVDDEEWDVKVRNLTLLEDEDDEDDDEDDADSDEDSDAEADAEAEDDEEEAEEAEEVEPATSRRSRRPVKEEDDEDDEDEPKKPKKSNKGKAEKPKTRAVGKADKPKASDRIRARSRR